MSTRAQISKATEQRTNSERKRALAPVKPVKTPRPKSTGPVKASPRRTIKRKAAPLHARVG